MAFTEYGAPGGGTDETGLSMVIQFPNNRIMVGNFYAYENFSEADMQAVLDAIAGIPGCLRVDFTEGKVSQRLMTPDREYEPLPPPPME